LFATVTDGNTGTGRKVGKSGDRERCNWHYSYKILNRYIALGKEMLLPIISILKTQIMKNSVTSYIFLINSTKILKNS
jgi:hypothetical protein